MQYQRRWAEWEITVYYWGEKQKNFKLTISCVSNAINEPGIQ